MAQCLAQLNNDALDRLTTVTKSGGNQSFTYDANGNRRTYQNGSQNSTYNYNATNNRVANITGNQARAYSYDSSGNTTGYLDVTLTYDSVGRLRTAVKGSTSRTYDYNASGQRVRKRLSATNNNYYMYDEDGRLIGEYNNSGGLIQEIVWLADTPVASLRLVSNVLTIYYIHTDHLNTPTLITQASNNQLRWRWDRHPFGTGTINANPSALGAFTFNFRFPGQYFDSETGLNYNYFRDYDPNVGRYVQSDPIGLGGGLNTYSYVLNRPTQLIDSNGKTPAAAGLCFIPAVGWVGCGAVAAGVVLVGGGLVLSEYLRKAPPRRSSPPPPPPPSEGDRSEVRDLKEHCTQLYVLCTSQGWGGDWSCGQCHFFCTGMNGYWPFEHCSPDAKCR